MGRAPVPPASVVLGGITYSVNFHPPESMDDGDVEGDINYKHARLRLQTGMDPEHTMQIFFHEISHGLAIEGEYNFILGLEGPDKERLVQLMGKALYRFCQDNDLSAYYQPKEEPKDTKNINNEKQDTRKDK